MRILLLSALLVLPVSAQFKAEDKDGRIEIHDGAKLVFAYQHQPLKEPKGGEKFAASAFIHPLTTPSGFVLTDIQPDDHLHHLGVWWPWKEVEVEGKKHVTWELQMKQGRYRALKAEIVRANDKEVLVRAQELTEITKDGKTYQPVIEGVATMRFARHGEDGYQLDIDLRHQPVAGVDVTIFKYRYSGFTWRGTADWTSEASALLSSGGHNRDNGNHQAAKWCLVAGNTPKGKATMLMMSAASKGEGKPELLRVWDAKSCNGVPFVNFNPVVKESIVMKEENKAVSHRNYRLIMVDREIQKDEADKLWKTWAASGSAE